MSRPALTRALLKALSIALIAISGIAFIIASRKLTNLLGGDRSKIQENIMGEAVELFQSATPQQLECFLFQNLFVVKKQDANHNHHGQANDSN